MAGAGRRGAAAPGWAEQSSLGSPGAGASEGPAWTPRHGVSRGGEELGGGREQRSEHRPGILGGPQEAQQEEERASARGRPAHWGGRERGSAGVRWGDGAPPEWGSTRAGRDQVGGMGETVCSLREWQPRIGTGSGVGGRGKAGGGGEVAGKRRGKRGQSRRPRIFGTGEGFRATSWLAPGGPGRPHFWGSHPGC